MLGVFLLGALAVLGAWVPAAADPGLNPPLDAVTVAPWTTAVRGVDLGLDGNSLAKADVLFVFDTTASMWSERAIAVDAATQIMASLTPGLVRDAHFGVAAFQDHPGRFCYESPRGPPFSYGTTDGTCPPGAGIVYGFAGESPFDLKADLTGDPAVVEAGLNALPMLFGGEDYPESHTRVLHEVVHSTDVHWRPGAKRIVIVFSDDVPHDDNLNEGVPDKTGIWSTGTDPGPDDLVGTEDDYNLQSVLAEVAASGTSVYAVQSDSNRPAGADPTFNDVNGDAPDFVEYWSHWLAPTGGGAVELAQADQLPAAIEAAVADAVADTRHLENVRLVPDPAGAVFFGGVDPTSVALDVPPEGASAHFDVTYAVPMGTPAGAYPLVLTAYGDADGASLALGEQTVWLTVPDVPPTPADDTAATPEDTTVSVPVLANDSDPNGDPVVPSTLTITGGPGVGAAAVDPATFEILYTPPEDYSGPDDLTYSVCDPAGNCAGGALHVDVTPVNDPPVASFTTDASAGVAPLGVGFDGSASADVDGSVVSWAWDFGDGTTGAGAAAAHTFDTPGLYPVALTVTDDLGATALASQPVLVVGAVADEATVPEDGQVVIDVLANDLDANLVPASVTWADGPGNGGISLDPLNGALTYVPRENWHGTDSFTYTVCDTQGLCMSAPVTVTVTPVNDAPVALFVASTTNGGVVPCETGVATLSSDVEGPIASHEWDFGDGGTATGETATHTYTQAGWWTVTLTVTDGEGAQASYSTTLRAVGFAADSATLAEDTTTSVDVLANDDGELIPAWTLEVTTPAAHGDAVVNPGTGTVDYTPAPDYHGPDSFTYKACDFVFGSCGEAVVTVTVTPVNDAPVAAVAASPTEGAAPLAVTLDSAGSGDPVDPEGRLVKWSWDFGDGTPVVHSSAPTTTHTYTAGGTHTASLTVTDDAGATATASTSVTVSSAAFTVDKTVGMAPLEVHFDASASPGPIVEYRWDYDGNGSIDETTSTPQAVFTYTTVSLWMPALEVAYADGSTSRAKGPRIQVVDLFNECTPVQVIGGLGWSQASDGLSKQVTVLMGRVPFFLGGIYLGLIQYSDPATSTTLGALVVTTDTGLRPWGDNGYEGQAFAIRTRPGGFALGPMTWRVDDARLFGIPLFQPDRVELSMNGWSFAGNVDVGDVVLLPPRLPVRRILKGFLDDLVAQIDEFRRLSAAGMNPPPLLGIDPLGADGLDVDGTLGTLRDRLAAAAVTFAIPKGRCTYSNPFDDFEALLDGIDFDLGPTSVRLSGPDPGDGDRPVLEPTLDPTQFSVSVGLEIKVRRTIAAPVAMAKADVPGETTAPLTLEFGAALGADLDVSKLLTPGQEIDAFSLHPSTGFHLRLYTMDPLNPDLATEVPVEQRAALFRLIEVILSGHAKVDVNFAVGLKDPDGDGRIGLRDWTSGLPIGELVDVGFRDAVGKDLDIALYADIGAVQPDGHAAGLTIDVEDLSTLDWATILDHVNVFVDGGRLICGFAQGIVEGIADEIDASARLGSAAGAGVSLQPLVNVDPLGPDGLAFQEVATGLAGRIRAQAAILFPAVCTGGAENPIGTFLDGLDFTTPSGIGLDISGALPGDDSDVPVVSLVMDPEGNPVSAAVQVEVAFRRRLTKDLSLEKDGIGFSVAGGFALEGRAALDLRLDLAPMNQEPPGPPLVTLGENTSIGLRFYTPDAQDPAATGEILFRPSWAVLGLLDLDVAGRGRIDANIVVGLHDPQGPGGDGLITPEELAGASFTDLVSVDFVKSPGNAGDDFDARIELDTPLVDGSPDGWVGVRVPDFSQLGHGMPNLTDFLYYDLGPLGGLDLAKIDVTAIIVGILRYLESLSKTATTGSFTIPFTDVNLGDALDAIWAPVRSWADMLVTARVQCGQNDTSPPSGGWAHFDEGEDPLIYCQVITPTGNAAGMTVDGVAQSGLELVTPAPFPAGTVGAKPTESIVFRVLDPAEFRFPNLRFNFTDGPTGGTKTAIPRVTSLDDLAMRVSTLITGNADTDVVHYDGNLHTLTIDFALGGGPLSTSAEIALGEELRSRLGVEGFDADAGSSLSASIGRTDLEIGLGVILAGGDQVSRWNPASGGYEALAQAGGGDSITDHFFLKVGAPGGEFSVADLSAEATVQATGRLGILGVDLRGNQGANRAFSLGRANPDTPAVSVAVNDDAGYQSNPLTVGGQAVPDAILISDFLRRPGDFLQASCNLRLDGGLEAQASLSGLGDLLGDLSTLSGDLEMHWPADPGGSLFQANSCVPDFAGFTAGPSPEFRERLARFTAGGVNLKAIIVAKLRELLRKWSSRLNSDDPNDILNQGLKVLNVKPKEVLGFVDRIEARLSLLERPGRNPGTARCATSPAAISFTGTARIPYVKAGQRLYCRAKTAGGAAAVRWNVTGGHDLTGATDPTTAGPDPSGSFSFEVDDPAAFAVDTAVTDDAGTEMASDFPSFGALPTIKDIYEALGSVLGAGFQGVNIGDLLQIDFSTPGEIGFRVKAGICSPYYFGLPGADPRACGTSWAAAGPDLATSLSLPANPGQPNLVEVDGSLDASVDYRAAFETGFRVVLPPEGGDESGVSLLVDRDSRVGAELRLAADTNFRARLGPLAVLAGTPSDPVKIRGRFGVSLAPNIDPGATEQYVPLSALTGVDLGVDTLAAAEKFDCGTAPDLDLLPTGDVCAHLPVYTQGSGGAPEAAGSAVFRIWDTKALIENGAPADPVPDSHPNLDLDVSDELLTNLGNAFLNLDFFDILDFVFERLQNELAAHASEDRLPLVGSSYGDVYAFVTDVRNGLGQLRLARDAIRELADIGALRTCIPEILTDVLGPAGFVGDYVTACGPAVAVLLQTVGFAPTGIGILQDRTGDSQVTPADVEVIVACKDAMPCTDADPLANVADVNLRLRLGGGTSVYTPVDLGIPGLSIQSRSDSSPASVALGWSVDLSFGVDWLQGFYIEGLPGQDEMTFGITARPPSDMKLTLGFLAATFTDPAPGPDSPNRVQAGLFVDLPDGKHYNGDALTALVDMDPSLRVDAEMNLDVAVGGDGGAGVDTGFPSLDGRFLFKYDDVTAGFNSDAGDGADPDTLAFEDVGLDFGSVLTKMLKPMAEDVRRYIYLPPVNDALDFLYTDMPVVTELNDMWDLGLNGTRVIDVVEQTCHLIAGGTPGGEILPQCRMGLVRTLNDVRGFLDAIAAMQGNLRLQLTPRFDIDGGAAYSASAPVDAASPAFANMVTTAPGRPADALEDEIAGGSGGARAFTEYFRLPWLDNPMSLVKVLFGTDASLVEFDTGKLAFHPDKMNLLDLNIPLWGIPEVLSLDLSIGIDLTVGIEGRVIVGYDTRGIRGALAEQGTFHAEKLLDGLYLGTKDTQGNKIDNLVFTAQVDATLAAALNTFFVDVELGLIGRLKVAVTVRFNDPNDDGKIYVDEIVALGAEDDLACLVNASVSLTASLSGYIDIRLVVFEGHWEIEFGSWNLPVSTRNCDGSSAGGSAGGPRAAVDATPLPQGAGGPLHLDAARSSPGAGGHQIVKYVFNCGKGDPFDAYDVQVRTENWYDCRYPVAGKYSTSVTVVTDESPFKDFDAVLLKMTSGIGIHTSFKRVQVVPNQSPLMYDLTKIEGPRPWVYRAWPDVPVRWQVEASDPDGDPMTYAVDCGNGTHLELGANPEFACTYHDRTSYRMQVWAYDRWGAFVRHEFPVDVFDNEAPGTGLLSVSPFRITYTESVRISVGAPGAADPDGDPDPAGGVAEWEFRCSNDGFVPHYTTSPWYECGRFPVTDVFAGPWAEVRVRVRDKLGVWSAETPIIPMIIFANSPPVVGFMDVPTGRGFLGALIRVDDVVIRAPNAADDDGTVEEYRFRLTSSDRTVTHQEVYTTSDTVNFGQLSPGVYNAVVNVRDDFGTWSSDEFYPFGGFRVWDTTAPSVALRVEPGTVRWNTDMWLYGDGANAWDSGDAITGYQFDCGNGNVTGWIAESAYNCGRLAGGIWYHAKVRVQDAFGDVSAWATTVLDVGVYVYPNERPVAGPLTIQDLPVTTVEDAVIGAPYATDSDGSVVAYRFELYTEYLFQQTLFASSGETASSSWNFGHLPESAPLELYALKVWAKDDFGDWSAAPSELFGGFTVIPHRAPSTFWVDKSGYCRDIFTCYIATAPVHVWWDASTPYDGAAVSYYEWWCNDGQGGTTTARDIWVSLPEGDRYCQVRSFDNFGTASPWNILLSWHMFPHIGPSAFGVSPSGTCRDGWLCFIADMPLTISWSTPTFYDGAGLWYYELSCSDGRGGSTTGNSYSFGGFPTGGGKVCNVRAWDTMGHASGWMQTSWNSYDHLGPSAFAVDRMGVCGGFLGLVCFIAGLPMHIWWTQPTFYDGAGLSYFEVSCSDGRGGTTTGTEMWFMQGFPAGGGKVCSVRAWDNRGYASAWMQTSWNSYS